MPETRAYVLSWFVPLMRPLPASFVRSTFSDTTLRYITTAALGSASGVAAAGRMIQWLQTKDGWTLLDAYHVCFAVYALMGVFSSLATFSLSPRCELKDTLVNREHETSEATEGLLEGHELSPVDSRHRAPEVARTDEPKTSRIAQISKETRSIMYTMWFLLMVDSLADGMASMTLTTYYMDEKFNLPKSTIGDVLSASYFFAACSTVFAGPLSRHIGLVNTMVFTHIPSSLAVMLFPVPQNKFFTFALLVIRVGLNNMDQAPRAALIAAVVRPEERTAVMGITSTLRTLANVTGPTFTGVLGDHNLFWVAFVVGGALRLAYDIGLFVMFINIKLYKYEAVRQEASPSSGSLMLDAFEGESEDDPEARLRLSSDEEEEEERQEEEEGDLKPSSKAHGAQKPPE